MTQKASRPQRFKIVLRNVSGGPFNYSVVTWLGERKAIALAVATHIRHKPDRGDIYDVEVDSSGPIELNPQGIAKLDRSDVSDRNEW